MDFAEHVGKLRLVEAPNGVLQILDQLGERDMRFLLQHVCNPNGKKMRVVEQFWRTAPSISLGARCRAVCDIIASSGNEYAFAGTDIVPKMDGPSHALLLTVFDRDIKFVSNGSDGLAQREASGKIAAWISRRSSVCSWRYFSPSRWGSAAQKGCQRPRFYPATEFGGRQENQRGMHGAGAGGGQRKCGV